LKTLLTTLNSKYIHLNLAIRLLYTNNRTTEGLSWKEFTIKEPIDTIADYCKDFDVVAFSCYIWNITPTLAVARAIKALNPSTQILLGGPEVSYEWQDVIALDEVDYIVIGEGEIPFKNFLNQYPDISEVKNLVSKTNEGVRFVPDATMFDLLEYSGVNPYVFEPTENLENKVGYIETSRGCPYKCEFCLASLDNKVRYLPTEDIKANLLYLMQHGRVIKFLDRTFNVKKNFSIDIFQYILDHHRPGNIFQFEITADIVHSDIVDFIQAHVPAGLFRFEIGIQTVNQKANLEVSRRQNFEKTSNIIRLLSDKIEMHLDLIVGLPFDYWEDIKYSFEEVFKLFPSELQLGFLKFLKGTPMRDKKALHGFIFDPEPPYQIIESAYLSQFELAQITVVEEALEIYWNKKRATRTLRYVTNRYGIFDFLLGVGTLFEKQADFHKHTLPQIFSILLDFVIEKYPTDAVLKELVAFDYYMYHKVKPKPFGKDEITTKSRNALVEKLGLPHTKFRFAVFEAGFDWQLYETTFEIKETKSLVVLQYSGTKLPEINQMVEHQASLPILD